MHAGLESGWRLEEQHLTACHGLWGRSREEAAVTWGALGRHLVRTWPRSQDGNGAGDRGAEGRVPEQSLWRQLCTQRWRPFPALPTLLRPSVP